MRALSGRADLVLQFDAAGAARMAPELGSEPPRALLPQPSQHIGTAELACLRGRADALALWVRHHDCARHVALAPSGGIALSVFDALEWARVEALGARRLAGVAINLDAALAVRLEAEGFGRTSNPLEVPLAKVIALLARRRMTGERWPAVADAVMVLAVATIGSRIDAELSALANAVDDQSRYAYLSLAIVDALGLAAARPTARDPGEIVPEPEGGEQQGGQARDEACGLEPELGLASAMGLRRSTFHDSTDVSAAAAPSRYQPFTRVFDEVVAPAEICDAAELRRLRRQLDSATAPFAAQLTRLAARFRRRLLAKSLHAWDFELEDGALDTDRLAAAIASPGRARVYKREAEFAPPDTAVALLVDNSGSMRGRAILLAALGADILARCLERCAVKVEVLGFTTRSWKGGRAREMWMAQGEPERPGRLAELRHIVYKTAEQPWRRAREGFGLMLHEGILKENIDGEALLWAHDRLLSLPATRRLLVLLADGAPSDESTASANPRGLLEHHLRQVVGKIGSRRAVDLVAIGIGHDLGEWYSKSSTVADVDGVAASLFGGLVELLELEPSRRRRRTASVVARRMAASDTDPNDQALGL